VEVTWPDDARVPRSSEGSYPELPKGRYRGEKRGTERESPYLQTSARAETRAVCRARGGGGRGHVAGHCRGWRDGRVGRARVNNPNAQGFQHFAKDSPISENAVQTNTAFINAMRYGGDILNVFGDFPTLTDPRHADAYSPLWDAQLAMWTPKAVSEGLNKCQINENEVLNLAYSNPDLLTGVNPATGQPQLYGSVGVDINCAVIGYTATAPLTPGPPNLPGSQFPPR
jgi:hypothetical protein